MHRLPVLVGLLAALAAPRPAAAQTAPLPAAPPTPAAAAPPASPAPLPPSSATPPARSPTPGLLLATFSATGFLAGGALLAGSRFTYDLTRSLTEDIARSRGTCAPNAPFLDPRCGTAESTANASNTLKVAGVASFVLAGATAAGAAVYFLWPAAPPITPTVGPGTAGLVFTGRF